MTDSVDDFTYDDYFKNQTVDHGMVLKPSAYHKAERIAIDYLFRDIPLARHILDVGCGIGQAMAYLNEKGYKHVQGLDLNDEKIFVAQCFGMLARAGDVARWQFRQKFEVIYCSHTFEHMFEPHRALWNLKEHAFDGADFIFILPYPDAGDPKAHLASFDLGTREDDDGESVVRYFTSRGLELIEKKMDDFREPEIWLHFRYTKI